VRGIDEGFSIAEVQKIIFSLGGQACFLVYNRTIERLRRAYIPTAKAGGFTPGFGKPVCEKNTVYNFGV
jgi:hypothetical protein